MAKSTRSKSKRAFRRTKRETGVYAAVDAARLHRLSNKLKAKIETDKDGDAPMEDEEVVAEGEDTAMSPGAEGASTTPQKVSTHGPRGSRREEWRKSKGMAPRSKSGNRMNKHGVVASTRRVGKTKRRR